MKPLTIRFCGWCDDDDWETFIGHVRCLATLLGIDGLKIENNHLIFGEDVYGIPWRFISRDYDSVNTIRIDINEHPIAHAKFIVTCVILYKYYNRDILIEIDEKLASKLYILL